MPTFNTQQLIAELLHQTESFLQKAVTDWQMKPDERMLQPPAPGKWSAAQCLEHLNSYGRYYLPALQKAIDDAVLKKGAHQTVFKTSRLGNYFTNLMMPGDDNKTITKMKAPKNHTPPSSLNSHAVVAEFIDQQEMLLVLLERAQRIDLRKAKVPVSISRFIKLPVGDTFRFLIAHNYRHILQAERALGYSVSDLITN